MCTRISVAQGKDDEAAPLCKEAIEIWKKVYGDEHPQVAAGLNNLAALLDEDPKNWDEAEKLYKESLAIRKKVLGEEHPDVAGSLNNLALLLSDQVRTYFFDNICRLFSCC